MEFRVLGPLEAWHDGRKLELGAGRQRALLALLLLHPDEAVSADRLVDDLWGEHPPPSATKVIQNYVSQLRRVLPADTIVTRDSGYLVRTAATDAGELQRLVDEARAQPAESAAATLRRALALWRGPPLADVAYESWAQAEIARLEELRLAALEERIDADLSLGKATQLVPELEALAAQHPLQERLLGQLMLALYRAGRQADALAVFANARQRLVDELGIEPGPELQAMQRRILSQDPALGPQVAYPLAAVAQRARWLVFAGVLVCASAVAAAALLLSRGGGSIVVQPNSVAVLDPATGHLVGDVQVGTRPVAVAVGAGAVWVANADDGTVSRIDPKTRKVVDVIGVGADVSAITVGFGSLWVADGNDGTVTRIDPTTNSIEATLPLDVGVANDLLPDPVYLLAVGGRFLWATRGDRLLRIDPITNQPTSSILVGTPLGLAGRGGAVWVVTLTEELLRIQADPLKLATSAQLATQGFAPVFAERSLWLITNLGHGEVARIDPDSLAETATTRTGTSPSDLASGGGAVWVTHDDGLVSRIDPRTTTATEAAHLPADPTALTVGYHHVWIAVDAANG